MPRHRLLAIARLILLFGFLGTAPAAPAQGLPSVKERAAQVQTKIDAELPALEKLYRQLHSHPELSYQEEQTAARLGKELKDLGFEVTAKVGGHGIVGVLRNGAGPTVMIRTDMDGLPVIEKTDLPYASKVRTRDKDGREVGTMHACGHDMHMTCWVGTAQRSPV